MNLYAHQQQVVDEKDRADRKFFGNWRGTGSGKTRSTVAIAEGVTLVVCPKKQFEDKIWEIEWKFQGKDEALLFVVSKEKFKSAVQKKEFLSLTGGKQVNTLIFDEAHKFAGVSADMKQKNYEKIPVFSGFFVAAMQYIQTTKPQRIHPLTATPTPTPLALWAFGTILGHDWDFKKFRECFYYETEIRGHTRWLPKFRRKAWPKSKPEVKAFIEREKKESIALAAKTKEMIGYIGKLEDWNDVPDQVFKPHYVGTTSMQEEKYKELKTLYPDPLVQVGKRQKLEQGLFDHIELQPDGTIKQWIERIPENKSEVIEEYLGEFRKIIIFARYTEQIDMYKEYFQKKNICDVFVLDGRTKDTKVVTDAAKASEDYILIAQSEVSSGWELPHCPCVIFASMDYSYVNYDQALGRVQRANNIKKNTYIYLLAGKGDELVKQVISEKEEFSEARYAEILCKSAKLQ